MNELQALHAKSMARHIREHATALVARMERIENDSNLQQVPDYVIGSIMEEARRTSGEIEQVTKDMLPGLYHP